MYNILYIDCFYFKLSYFTEEIICFVWRNFLKKINFILSFINLTFNHNPSLYYNNSSTNIS